MARAVDCPPRLRPVLQAVTALCEDDPAVLAAWLGGSLARGIGDDWSDIDLHVLVDDPDGFPAGDWAGRALELVLVDPIPRVPGGYILITPDWVHVDLIVHGREGFRQGPHPATVLVERSGLVHDVPVEDGPVFGEPYLPDSPATLFLYFMGNLPTVVHRSEWIAVMQGTAMMRDALLVQLMLAENGVRKSDGAKRLNRYLTQEQRDALAAIPAVGTDPEQLQAAQVAIAREYLTRSRRLHERLGAEWPDELETAARGVWSRELGLTV